MKSHFAKLLLVFPFLLPVGAHACGSGAVQYSDNFNPPNSGWGKSTAQNKKGNGLIAIKAIPGNSSYTMNGTYLFSDADICVRAKVLGIKPSDTPSGGLLFWAADVKSYYVFVIRPDGNWSVFRYAGRWITVDGGTSNAVKKGAGAENEVEVRTSGSSAEAFVNGKSVAKFNGQPPEGGGSIGLYGESADKYSNVWEFRDLKVLKLP